MPPPTFTQSLGLAASVTPLNVFALSSSALFCISFLVFLSTIQPYFLTTVLHVPAETLGRATGNLILADEILSLVLVFAWGVAADAVTVRWVAVAGHLIVGLGFLAYSRAGSVYPSVLLARLVFATGASGLLTALGAALAGMTALPSSAKSTTPEPRAELPPRMTITRASTSSNYSRDSSVSERTVQLLSADPERPSSPPPTASEPDTDPRHAAKFAGILGFASGCGALVGVFGFFRLPGLFTALSATSAIRSTFVVVALVAFAEGIFLSYGLKQRVTPALTSVEEGSGGKELIEWKKKLKELVDELPKGFKLAKNDGQVALAMFSSFTTRGQSLIVTAFIPLYIEHYFLSKGCATPCHRSIVLSASLTGTIQLISLLLAPAIGILTPYLSSPLTLSISSLLGFLSFLTFAFLPDGDPTGLRVWFAGVGAGASQIGGIVVGLALVAERRAAIMATSQNAKEVGGSISGVYSACGGLGILVVGKVGGSLFDKWVGAPFLLISILSLGAALFGLFIYWGRRHGTIILE